MKQSIIETVVGFIAILVALAFLVFSYTSYSPKIENSYVLKASFQNVEGIVKGSNVILAGVKVGSVTSITLDKTSFLALVTINIVNDVKLPKDTSIAIVTSGIIGNRYISVIPGASEENLSNGEQIRYTQSSVNIESLIGRLIYSFGNSKK